MSEKLFNRDLSWLEFNARVLGEGMDASNPLLERLKFLGITSSNFDEFFMVPETFIVMGADRNKIQIKFMKGFMYIYEEFKPLKKEIEELKPQSKGDFSNLIKSGEIFWKIWKKRLEQISESQYAMERLSTQTNWGKLKPQEFSESISYEIGALIASIACLTYTHYNFLEIPGLTQRASVVKQFLDAHLNEIKAPHAKLAKILIELIFNKGKYRESYGYMSVLSKL